MSDKYILIGTEVVEEPDLIKWGKWFETATNRRVADFNFKDVRVSTVFLGLDHSFGDGVPLLFETMIFGGEHDEYQERCSTYQEAIEMHRKAVELVMKARR